MKTRSAFFIVTVAVLTAGIAAGAQSAATLPMPGHAGKTRPDSVMQGEAVASGIAQNSQKNDNTGQSAVLPQGGRSSPDEPSRDKGASGTISDPEMGISFLPPRGWSAQKRPEGYVLGSDAQPGVIIVIPHEFSDLAELSSEARFGLEDEENGIALKLSSQIVPYGKNGIAGELRGLFQGQEAKAYAIGIMSPRGGGVIVLAAVEPKSYSRLYPQLVQEIVSSVAFLK